MGQKERSVMAMEFRHSLNGNVEEEGRTAVTFIVRYAVALK